MNLIIKMAFRMLGKWGIIKYMLLGISSGLCGFLFITAVTKAVSIIIAGNMDSVNTDFLLVFIAIILFSVWIRRTLAKVVIDMSQMLFWGIRKQIIELVLKSNYQQLSAKKVDIQAAIVNDVNVLTQASINIIDFFTAIILATSCFVYLATISLVLFSITLVFVIVGIAIYQSNTKKNIKSFETARLLENNFIANYTAIIDGFKEIYLEQKKGKAIYEEKISPVSQAAFNNNTIAFTGFLNNQITGQILFYMLITSVLLFFSVKLELNHSDTISFIFTLLYLLNSIESIMALLPGLMRAKVASNHMMKLNNDLLTDNSQISQVDSPVALTSDFDQLKLHNLEFVFENTDSKPFRIGPINMTVNKGDVIFIYGGNGSGKTTLLYTILGIYKSGDNHIALNGILVQQNDQPIYKALFGAVFSDFYVFDELFGIDDINLPEWNFYLNLFDLKDKVNLSGKRFSTINISTGQRKRLGLINVLLEKKPILVLDEWAADQDPYFRKKFYTEIIPILKNRGFTILAITHDDNYYHCADQLYKMEYGKLIKEQLHSEFESK